MMNFFSGSIIHTAIPSIYIMLAVADTKRSEVYGRERP